MLFQIRNATTYIAADGFSTRTLIPSPYFMIMVHHCNRYKNSSDMFFDSQVNQTNFQKRKHMSGSNETIYWLLTMAHRTM